MMYVLSALLFVGSGYITILLVRFSVKLLLRWEARKDVQAEQETWPTFDPKDDFERWLLQRTDQTFGEFFDKIEHDREAARQRLTKFAPPPPRDSLFGYKVMIDQMNRRVYCFPCQRYLTMEESKHHVHQIGLL